MHTLLCTRADPESGVWSPSNLHSRKGKYLAATSSGCEMLMQESRPPRPRLPLCEAHLLVQTAPACARARIMAKVSRCREQNEYISIRDGRNRFSSALCAALTRDCLIPRVRGRNGLVRGTSARQLPAWREIAVMSKYFHLALVG